jgi:hypothetical protein
LKISIGDFFTVLKMEKFGAGEENGSEDNVLLRKSPQGEGPEG